MPLHSPSLSAAPPAIRVQGRPPRATATSQGTRTLLFSPPPLPSPSPALPRQRSLAPAVSTRVHPTKRPPSIQRHPSFNGPVVATRPPTDLRNTFSVPTAERQPAPMPPSRISRPNCLPPLQSPLLFVKILIPSDLLSIALCRAQATLPLQQTQPHSTLLLQPLFQPPSLLLQT